MLKRRIPASEGFGCSMWANPSRTTRKGFEGLTRDARFERFSSQCVSPTSATRCCTVACPAVSVSGRGIFPSAENGEIDSPVASWEKDTFVSLLRDFFEVKFGVLCMNFIDRRRDEAMVDRI
jgi:hypothetical protein